MLFFDSNGQEQEKQKEAAVKQQVVVAESEPVKITEKPIKEITETKKSDHDKKHQKSKHKHHSESSASRRRKGLYSCRYFSFSD